MWPFDSGRDVLRVGRRAVEYWARNGRGLALRDAVPLHVDGMPSAEALATGMRALAQRGSAVVDVVLESAWSPVIALELPQGWWPREKLDALLRHHVHQLYGPAEGGEWALPVVHRAGEAVAVGHALAPGTRSAVQRTMSEAGLRVASLQPALNWGWHRFAHARKPRLDWWVWVEQDRSLVCGVRKSRIASINAGAPVPTGAASVARLVGVECARRGIDAAHSAVVTAGWETFAVPASSPALASAG